MPLAWAAGLGRWHHQDDGDARLNMRLSKILLYMFRNQYHLKWLFTFTWNQV